MKQTLIECLEEERDGGGIRSSGRSNSPIHKAAGSLVTGRSLQNGKMSMGNCRTERPPDPVLYGGRPSGGFVNRAVTRIKIINDRAC